MRSRKGFRHAILHPASLCTLLLLTLSLIALVEYGCRALPSTNHDVFQTHRRRELDTISVTRPELVDKPLTMTIIETISITSTPQARPVPRHHKRVAKPQGTSAPNPNAYLNTKPTSTSSAPVETIPKSKAFLQTTSEPLSSANPSAYLQPEKTPEPGAPNRDAFLQAENGHVDGPGKYFVGAYLPTFLAVLFALPWLILNRTIVSLEPFYQLSHSGGAPAESTLTASLTSFAMAFDAIKNRQWAVVLSTLLMLLSIVITPIAPDTVSIQTIRECSHTTTGCSGIIRILIPAARVIQAILALMSVASIVLIVVVWRRRMKMSLDPRSIAGLASISLDPSVRQDFKESGAKTSRATLKAALSGCAYQLDFKTRYDGASLISLAKTKGKPTSPVQVPYKHDYSVLDWNQTLRLAPQYRLSASLFFLFLLALEVLIITYHFTGGDTGFENFMSGQGFGVRFLFTCLGILISRYWEWSFQRIALIAPYSSLAEGNASARESILLTPPAHALLALRSSVSARHIVFTVVTVVALLSEILTITLATIPFSSANLWTAYEASTWISAGIIALMMLTLVLLFFYHEPLLPVKPDSIAGHLVYLVDSSLPDLFADMAVSDTKVMQKKIEGLGLRYRLRPARDVAGMLTVDVDEPGVPHNVIVNQR